jgi:cytoskeletal protein CcmA (bactofilin family)
MKTFGKITRILLKTVLFSVLLVLVLLFTLFFVGQTETFQTWAAHRATNYLSKELGTKVEIDRLKISFIKNVTLEGIFVGDKHGDTLVSGKSIRLDVSGFSYKLHHLNLDEAELTDVKVKLLKYKNEEDFNFQFLADYFASTDTTKKDSSSPWIIKYGGLKLNNVDFTYHLLKDTNRVVQNMNYQNIHVSHVYGKLSDIDFRGDTIFAQITHLSAQEQCGIVLKNLTTKARVSSTELNCDSLYLQTENSLVKGSLQFKYDHWIDYTDFITKIYMKGNLKDSTKLCMKDVTYFAEEINGFNEIFLIKGKIRGFVNDLSGTKMDVTYAKNTEFKGDISMTGLPDFKKTFIHFDAEKLRTSKADLESFPLPPFNKPTYLKLPTEFSKLGVIDYKGKFDGLLDNFVAYGTLKTAIGSIKTDLSLKNVTDTKLVEYSGTLQSNNFNVSKLFPSTGVIGPISLSAKIKGKGFEANSMNTMLDGNIQAITYNNYKYENVKVDGLFKNKIFKGDLISKDPNADFDFDGTIDFNKKVPKMDFISTINNFDLEKTHLSTPQLNGKVSSQILINLNGDGIDNLSGLVNFDNTIYTNAEKKYTLSSFNLELDQATAIKNIKLNSNIANLQLAGRYKLSTLPNAFKQYFNAYFPTFFKTSTRHIYNDRADITVKVKNFTIVKELFLKNLMISSNTIINGSFDAGINYLYLNTTSDLVNYNGIKFKQNNLVINSLPHGINVLYNSKKINITDSFAFQNPSVNINSNDRTSKFDIGWNNFMLPNNAGNITGNAYFGNSKVDISIEKSKFTVADSTWQLVKENIISIDTAYSVKVNPLTFYNQNQLITFDGILSTKHDDKIDVFIQNFKLNQFNGLLVHSQISLDGTVTGNVNVNAAFGQTIINSDINFNQFIFNNRLIGNGEIKSEYNPEKEAMSINGYSAFGSDLDGNQLKNFRFNGFYYPKKTTDNIDITFNAEPLDISLLQPFLKSIMTIKRGYINGNGTITGSLDKPQINGKFKLLTCLILVDFLNVQYGLSGNVEIKPTQINFDNIEMRDKVGNTGVLSGNIFHDNFKNMRIDFDVNTNKLLLLNTTSANNSTYYGTAYASGNAGLYGFLDDIKMEINMKTNAGTHMYIPLDGPAEIGKNDFIHFVTKDTIKQITNITPSNFSLDFNLEATPDAEVQLIFDEKSGDVIKERGEGNLNMKINSKGKFDMFGDYNLTSGDYLFTLENFITKKFDIQKGSNIKWNGNVYKAVIDIEAVYRQRASVRPIYPADSSGKRYPVECKLYMRNKLTQPDITFGIDLPTIDENSRSIIKSILSDPNELNRQVFSLLLLRSFITPISVSGGGGISATGAAAATGSEMLSNKLSNWLNGVTKDVDVGVNYRPGTGLSNDQLDLTLNKQLFNNRLTIDGNFGVNNNANKSSNSSNLIGDVSVEYKLSQSGRYRVKGFNRSNDNTQILNSGGPFTQGVGIFYREEFQNLSELFRRYLGKIKKK